MIQYIGPIELSPQNTWNISAWEMDELELLSLFDYFEFNFTDRSFLEVFGNETDNRHNWKMVWQWFVVPYKIYDENGDVMYFADYYASLFNSIEGDVDIDTSDHDIHLNGTIYGEFDEIYIELET